MKKVLVISLIFLAVLGCLALAARLYLPTVAFRMLGRAIGGTVEASSTSVSFRGGLLVLRLEGITLKGGVEGTIGTCELRVQPSKGVYVKYFTISDFDIKVGREKARIGLYPVPVEFAEIRKGTVDYGGRKYVLREMTVTNFNTGGRMQFTIDGGVEGLGNLKTRGEGIFGDKRSDVEGDYRLSGVHMDRVLKDYEGLADSSGTFTYRDGRLVMDGRVEAPYFSLWEKFLRKRLVSLDNDCHIHLEREGGVSDVTLKGLNFKGTPVFLKFTGDAKKLLSLDLSTGLMRIPDLVEYIEPSLLSEGDWGPLSYIKDGNMRIEGFAFRRGKPITAQIAVRDVDVGDGRINFTDVAGSLRLSDTALALDGFEGRLGRGRISGVSGTLPLRLDRDVRIKGSFALDLADLSRIANTTAVDIVSGTTEGEVELTGREGRGFTAEGSGTVKDGRFLLRKTPFRASGSYAFRNGSVTLAPMVVSAAGTSLRLRGKAGQGKADLAVKGVVDCALLQRLAGLPYPVRGPLAVDGTLAIDGGAFRAGGSLSMTGVSVDAPRFFRKEAGLASSAALSVHGRIGGDVIVDNLALGLGPLSAFMSGRVGRRGLSGVHLVLNAPGVESLSRLFFFDDVAVGGDLKADITLDDLPFPVTSLPRMKGYLSLARGHVRFPGLENPMTGIGLSCKLEGESFSVVMSGLRSGTSVLKSARLVVTGITHPSFALAVDMDRLDPADFVPKGGKGWTIPTIAEGSLAARTTGEFVITSGTLEVRGVAGSDLSLRGTFGNRRLAVTEGRLRTAEGSLAVEGSAHLSALPVVNVAGSVKDMTAPEFLALFGGKRGIFDGKGSMSGRVTLTGRDGAEMARSASGRVTVESRDGVIRKWNIISRVLALTNVYDLFRGRVDLTRQGLVYRTLKASFKGEKGVFHTDDFVIDSPSMLITGKGGLDVGRKEISARMTVSPFVTLDKLIDLIPLVRNIVRERGAGIIFFTYNIKGPAADPEVKSSYVRSVGSKPLHMLLNTLNLPKEAWDELRKELGR